MTCRTRATGPEQSKTEYALALLRVVELARGPQAPPAASDPDESDELLALAAAGRTAPNCGLASKHYTASPCASLCDCRPAGG